MTDRRPINKSVTVRGQAEESNRAHATTMVDYATSVPTPANRDQNLDQTRRSSLRILIC